MKPAHVLAVRVPPPLKLAIQLLELSLLLGGKLGFQHLDRFCRGLLDPGLLRHSQAQQVCLCLRHNRVNRLLLFAREMKLTSQLGHHARLQAGQASLTPLLLLVIIVRGRPNDPDEQTANKHHSNRTPYAPVLARCQCLPLSHGSPHSRPGPKVVSVKRPPKLPFRISASQASTDPTTTIERKTTTAAARHISRRTSIVVLALPASCRMSRITAYTHFTQTCGAFCSA